MIDAEGIIYVGQLSKYNEAGDVTCLVVFR
jgi:hypothetical protein